jgi:hypothetical protein
VEDTERFRLLGTYQTPRCRMGQRVRCAVRGQVEIVGLSDAPIPWPLCRYHGHHAPVVYKGLLWAVRRESEQAIVHWWGVGVELVWNWRMDSDAVYAFIDGALEVWREVKDEV